MLEMKKNTERNKLKTYFYDWHPYLDLMFFIGIITMFFGVGVVLLLIWAVIRIAILFMSTSGDEVLYDRIRTEDIDYLSNRAVKAMGVIEDEYSLIDPIIAFGYASNETINVENATVNKKDLLARIGDYFKSIVYRLFVIINGLMGRKEFISKLIFFEGNDNQVRSSLVSFTKIVFTEKQIISYTCNYDIALGIILNEYVRELFYRDVDSVTYGDGTLHIFTKKFRWLRVKLTKIRMAVPSGRDVVAVMQGETDILENQIMAAKSLIRNKKTEMA